MIHNRNKVSARTRNDCGTDRVESVLSWLDENPGATFDDLDKAMAAPNDTQERNAISATVMRLKWDGVVLWDELPYAPRRVRADAANGDKGDAFF